ncbi:helix-turn-helix transcriptional regulator [Streptosporangium sp. NPDC023825]|uniref:helix-turn-helix domain-containing protein n=1 Tax=Streptosporangium sp. NPDC023825 TaxID=3154909 RepID=UPI0034174EBC
MDAQQEVDPASETTTFFGRELRKFREAARLSQSQLGSLVSVTQGYIGHIERGTRIPANALLLSLDAALGANGQLSRLWPLLSNTSGIPSPFVPWIMVEQGALALSLWDPMIVPGLLQVEGYARQILRGEPGIAKSSLDERLAGRLARRELLTRKDAPMIWVVLDEGVLHRPLGGSAVMREQLKYLLKVSDLPNVTIQVVPYAAQSTSGLLGSFRIAQNPGGSYTVYVESAGPPQVTEQVDLVSEITNRFNSIRASANPAHISRQMIEAVAEGKTS